MSGHDHALSAATFAQLAAELHARPDPVVTADTAVHQLREWIGDAHSVSFTELSGRRWQTLAATDDLARTADELQYELGEGPCRDAATRTTWLRSGDVAGDPRWPVWGPRAAGGGVGSLLSIPIMDVSGPASAVNIYSRDPGAFDDRDLVDQCAIYAVHAAHAMSSARRSDDLHTALTSRHTIGMAQGIVMERYDLAQQQSFDLLRRLSTSTNTKLRELAAGIVETRALPHARAPDPAELP
jgi:hypothetical protein